MKIDTENWTEQLESKLQVLEKTFESCNHNANRILFIGYNPVVLLMRADYDCTVVSQYCAGIVGIKTIDSIEAVTGTYDTVIALDEYICMLDSEIAQKTFLQQISRICRGLFITSVRDYKNLAPHRKLHAVAQHYNKNNRMVIVETCDPNTHDKQAWTSQYYYIENEVLRVLPKETHRTIYFKQLARYCYDVGCRDYIVQKNILYKNYLRHDLEHIITVRF